MLSNQPTMFLCIMSLFLALCLATVALVLQRHLTVQAQPLSNKARAVLEHHISSNDLANRTKEHLNRQQNDYLAAYRARRSNIQPIIEEVQ